MQRENILYMTDTIDVASFLADFYVLYKFASLEYVKCTGILITGEYSPVTITLKILYASIFF
jgi:hypothetical protein